MCEAERNCPAQVSNPQVVASGESTQMVAMGSMRRDGSYMELSYSCDLIQFVNLVGEQATDDPW